MKRPGIVTLWAVLLALAGLYDYYGVATAYVFGSEEYSELNPGILGVFRPFAWATAALVPIGLWLARRWAVVLYVAIQITGVALIYIERPVWMDVYPAWALPVALVFPAIFLLTVLPVWKSMSSRIP